MPKLILLIITLLCTYSTHSLGEKETLFLTEIYPPYVYESDGNLTGHATEVAKQAFELAGIPADIKVYPFARTIRLAKNSVPLIAYPVVRNPERDAYFDWLGLVASDDYYLFKLSSRTAINVKTLDDLRDLTICSIRGGIIESYLKKKSIKNIVDVTDIEQGIRMLKVGHVDLLPLPKLTVDYYVKQKTIGDSMLEPVFRLKDLALETQLAASKSVPKDIRSKLKSALEKIHSLGKSK